MQQAGLQSLQATQQVNPLLEILAVIPPHQLE
jgi:hypothetical protein